MSKFTSYVEFFQGHIFCEPVPGGLVYVQPRGVDGMSTFGLVEFYDSTNEAGFLGSELEYLPYYVIIEPVIVGPQEFP